MKLIAALFIFGFLQMNILPGLWPFKIKPDLFLVSVIFIGLNSELRTGLIFAFFCGLFKDIFSLRLFGFNTISFCVYAGLASLISRYIYKEIPGIKFIIIASLTILNYLLLWVIFRRPYIFLALPEAFLNCLAFIPVARFYSSTLHYGG